MKQQIIQMLMLQSPHGLAAAQTLKMQKLYPLPSVCQGTARAMPHKDAL